MFQNDENGLFETRYLFMKRKAVYKFVKREMLLPRSKEETIFFLFAYFKY